MRHECARGGHHGLIDACVMECYFREHMAERNLLFHDELAPRLTADSPDLLAIIKTEGKV